MAFSHANNKVGELYCKADLRASPVERRVCQCSVKSSLIIRKGADRVWGSHF